MDTLEQETEFDGWPGMFLPAPNNYFSGSTLSYLDYFNYTIWDFVFHPVELPPIPAPHNTACLDAGYGQYGSPVVTSYEPFNAVEDTSDSVSPSICDDTGSDVPSHPMSSIALADYVPRPIEQHVQNLSQVTANLRSDHNYHASSIESSTSAFLYDGSGSVELPTSDNHEQTGPSSAACPLDDEPRRQSPRFEGDEYTATWVRGSGVGRAGLCKKCSTWHTLKDSAYWYHLQYSHGISCHTGKAFQHAKELRSSANNAGWEALCGCCSQWINVGRDDRWSRSYFRHAYKCHPRHRPTISRTRFKSTSPRKSLVRPAVIE